MAIILQEALRGLFYAPFYVALARGAIAAEGTAHVWCAAARRASAPGARDRPHPSRQIATDRAKLT